MCVCVEKCTCSSPSPCPPTHLPTIAHRRRPSRIGKDRSSLRPSRYPRGHDRSKKGGGGIGGKRKKAKTAVAPLEKGCLVAAH